MAEDVSSLAVEIADGVAIVVLDRPDKLNALDRRTNQALYDAIMAADADPGIGCIVVTGRGDRAFSAGGDIHEMRALEGVESAEDAAVHRDHQARQRFEMATCATPTIAMVNGLAYGGAAALAMCFDLRLGCEHAEFRFLAATYGRVNATWSLPRQIAWPVAKELLFTGRVVHADEAARLGLLNHLVPCAQLRDRTLEMAATIAAADREAIAAIKLLLTEGLGDDLETQWRREVDRVGRVPTSSAGEAFARVLSKRKVND